MARVFFRYLRVQHFEVHLFLLVPFGAVVVARPEAVLNVPEESCRPSIRFGLGMIRQKIWYVRSALIESRKV